MTVFPRRVLAVCFSSPRLTSRAKQVHKRRACIGVCRGPFRDSASGRGLLAQAMAVRRVRIR